MKKLLLILLCVPLIGLGQSFDFNDIKKINSEKMFKVFALENLYSNKTTDSLYFLQYLYKPEFFPEVSPTEASWSSDIYWSLKKRIFRISFFLDNEEANKTFETIINQIKSECKFYDIHNSDTICGFGFHYHRDYDEIVCYSCSSSKYKGKIGFYIQHNTGYIETFDF